MTFKKPFLTVGSSASIVAKGGDVYIKGTAEGKPASVSYYILGTNYFANGTISVENDGNFKKKLTLSTQDAGQYFVVVEHPMEQCCNLNIHEYRHADDGEQLHRTLHPERRVHR